MTTTRTTPQPAQSRIGDANRPQTPRCPVCTLNIPTAASACNRCRRHLERVEARAAAREARDHAGEFTCPCHGGEAGNICGWCFEALLVALRVDVAGSLRLCSLCARVHHAALVTA